MDLSDAFKHAVIDLAYGCTASAVSKTIQAPIIFLKLILPLQGNATPIEQKVNGTRVLICRIIKNYGVKNLWKNNLKEVMWLSPRSGLVFALNDLYKIIYRIFLGVCSPKIFIEHLGRNLVAGGMAVGTSMFFTYPVGLYRIELARKASSRRFFVSAGDEVLFKSHKPISYFY